MPSALGRLGAKVRYSGIIGIQIHDEVNGYSQRPDIHRLRPGIILIDCMYVPRNPVGMQCSSNWKRAGHSCSEKELQERTVSPL